MTTQIVLLRVASTELQRVASVVLHIVSAAGRVLRAKHVRRSGSGELSQVSRASGERGEDTKRERATRETRAQMETYESSATLSLGEIKLNTLELTRIIIYPSFLIHYYTLVSQKTTLMLHTITSTHIKQF